MKPPPEPWRCDKIKRAESKKQKAIAADDKSEYLVAQPLLSSAAIAFCFLLSALFAFRYFK
jgi:hypothetical protein